MKKETKVPPWSIWMTGKREKRRGQKKKIAFSFEKLTKRAETSVSEVGKKTTRPLRKRDIWEAEDKSRGKLRAARGIRGNTPSTRRSIVKKAFF